jgi:two-component system cell cycle sensor histidine kinase/response regulator CckA
VSILHSETTNASYEGWKVEPRWLFDQATEAVLIFDDNLEYVDANPAACQLLRRSKQEIVGRHVGDFSTEDGSRLACRIREAQGAAVVEENLKLTLCDGNIRYVELVARPNILPGIHVSFSRDVTERHELQQELEHHSRLEAIGRVAGGVAHDFNNMLTAILSYADLQLKRAGDDSEMRRYALGIQAAAERAAETTQQLLAFCRRQSMKFRQLDVNEIVREAATLVQRLIGEDVQLVLELERNLPPVLADAAQLNQVLMNLAVNARDAMPNGGSLLFGTAVRQSSTEKVRALHASQVSIFVHDTGSGICADVLPHIFDPFFTTKPQRKGTGLGLSTVYGIVKQSQGQIFVNSTPGKGTTFEVVLPAASKFQLAD